MHAAIAKQLITLPCPVQASALPDVVKANTAKKIKPRLASPPLDSIVLRRGFK